MACILDPSLQVNGALHEDHEPFTYQTLEASVSIEAYEYTHHVILL